MIMYDCKGIEAGMLKLVLLLCADIIVPKFP